MARKSARGRASPVPRRVYIGFCESDRAWRNRLRQHLRHCADVTVWDRSDADLGLKEAPQAARMRTEAHVLILLVSAAYLASSEGEADLKALAAALAPGAPDARPRQEVLWLPVGHTAWRETALKHVAPACPVEGPLSELSGPEKERALLDVASRVAGRPLGSPARLAMRGRRYAALGVALILLGTGSWGWWHAGRAGSGSPPPARPVPDAAPDRPPKATTPMGTGPCEAAARPAPDLFSKEPGLKVLVARFHGGDERARQFGEEVSQLLKRGLEDYARTGAARGLGLQNLWVRSVECTLAGHREAREVGKAWGADLVFWGSASCSLARPQDCHLAPVLQMDGPPADPGATGARVALPLEKGAFKTSLTVVAWRGLETVQEKSVAVRLDPQAIQDLDFPRIAADRPILLFHFVLGAYAFFSQRFRTAAERFQHAAQDLYAGTEDQDRLYRLIGTSYLLAGLTREGLAALEQAVRACQAQDVPCRMRAQSDLAWAYNRLGEKDKALQLWKQVMPRLLEGGNLNQAVATMTGLGVVTNERGDRMAALHLHDEALQVARATRNRTLQAAALSNAAAVHADLGDRKKALALNEEALSIATQDGNLWAEAEILSTIGYLQGNQGEPVRALSSFERALALAQQIGEPRIEGYAMDGICVLHMHQREHRQALEWCQRALVQTRKAGDMRDEASTLGHLAAAFSALREWKRALETYDQAVALARRVGDVLIEARVLQNEGYLLRAMGQPAAAIERLRAAAARYQGPDPKSKTGPRRCLDHHLDPTPRAVACPETALAAQTCLEDALELALRSNRWDVARSIVVQAGELGFPMAHLALLRARLLGRTWDPEAPAAYQRLAQVAPLVMEHPRRIAEVTAQAGALRIRRRADFGACPGVAILDVAAGSPAEKLALRRGDVLLRRQSRCIYEEMDLMPGTPAGRGAEPEIILDVVREHGIQLLSVPDRPLGLSVVPF